MTKFCAGDFSRTIQRFSTKLSQNMCYNMKLLLLKENLENTIPVPSYGQFPDFKMQFCRPFLSKMAEYMNWRLIGDDRSWLCGLRNRLFVRRQYFRFVPEGYLKNAIFQLFCYSIFFCDINNLNRDSFANALYVICFRIEKANLEIFASKNLKRCFQWPNG